MAQIYRELYIPAGCLGLAKDEAGLDEETWASPSLRSWNRFRPHTPPSETANADAESQFLTPDVQDRLRQAPNLRDLFILFRALWVDLEFRIDSANLPVATIRVYLLPDDIGRREIHRSKRALKRIRNRLLTMLDYSDQAWLGQSSPCPTAPWPASPSPLQEEAGAAQEESLLRVFNMIPSPNPEPRCVEEPRLQNVMCNLLDGTVPGLTTELYPYQRRSAALMLQKESQPGRILDPRLAAAEDRGGLTWYFDPVGGTVLSEPRFYDDVAGGILAEEMGSGKTIICLALILATQHFPTNPPEPYAMRDLPVRRKVGSLADMAAACATRHGVPWQSYFDHWKQQSGMDFTCCTEALKRNPSSYLRPRVASRQPRRTRQYQEPSASVSDTILLSSASVVVVPNNLFAQWKKEIQKHTMCLRVLYLVGDDPLPEADMFQHLDLVLFSQSRFERIMTRDGGINQSPLDLIHFKRCIVDEGHKLGNCKISNRSLLSTGLDQMIFSSRWIVTGTPSQGLFGVQDTRHLGQECAGAENPSHAQYKPAKHQAAAEMEKRDLQRLGSIASLYLKARPWANAATEAEDERADWDTYLLLPKHNKRSRGRWDCLKSILNSLIIRHRVAEVGDLLPPVDEKVVVLDGSFQDRLSLNIFAMMIVFNSVQSQRTDVDYFFHPRQRKSLLQIVQNLKQASFFGGSFFSSDEISNAVETAETFLREKKVPISEEDEILLQEAIKLGHVAVGNKLRRLSNKYHEIPVCVESFPGNASHAWSLDGRAGDNVCTSASLLSAAQKLIHDAVDAPEQLNSLLNGGLIHEGVQQRRHVLADQASGAMASGNGKKSETKAGNTRLGDDSPRKPRTRGRGVVEPKEKKAGVRLLPVPFKLTKITATVSAKLSYLIDSITRHQELEKMIVFYENENVAWYLASMLDVLQIRHLIYAKGLTAERRARYVGTFQHSPTFRVLLMDLSQAAFGLDMHEASRVYFINPVLNPQVEAQAIGRVRRISQKKPVSVETLVLRNSLDEVILERKRHMSPTEHRQAKSILDVRPIYNWIKNARVESLPDVSSEDKPQMAALWPRQLVFDQDLGRTSHPDEGLISEEVGEQKGGREGEPSATPTTSLRNSKKRLHDDASGGEDWNAGHGDAPGASVSAARPARRRRIRFTPDSNDDE